MTLGARGTRLPRVKSVPRNRYLWLLPPCGTELSVKSHTFGDPDSTSSQSKMVKMAVGSIYGHKTCSGHLWQIITQMKCQKVEISVKVLENGGQVAC